MSALEMIARVRRMQALRAKVVAAATKPLSRTEQNESLLDFIPRVSPQLERPEHLRPLVEALESTVSQPRRILVSTPPQHGKTFTVSHGLVWLLLRRPHLRNAYITYEQTRADEVSLAIQRVAHDAGLPFDGSRRGWRTPSGGGLIATGIGGRLTGYGVDGLLLVDDPVKNRVDAESETMRRRAIDWFRDVAMSRVHPGASVIVVQTRWHPEDLAGSLEREGRYDVINLPAVGDDGAALWEARRPLAWLQQQRESIGEYSWASLYMGRPRPPGGVVFHDVQHAEDLPRQYRVAIGIDFAYTAKTHADYSVAVVLAEAGGKYFVLDVKREQCDAPSFAGTLRQLRASYPGAKMFSYIGGTEKGVVDFLRTQGVAVHGEPARADKFVRAQPVAAAWNAKRVLLARSAAWVPAFVSELASFTGVNDKHDDQVDALAGAFAALNEPPPPYRSLPSHIAL